MDFTKTQRSTLYVLVAVIALVSVYVRVKGNMARRAETSYHGSASHPAYPRSNGVVPAYGHDAQASGAYAPPAQGRYGANLQGGQKLGSASAAVNINTGSLQELDRLPGVGPVLAGRIVELRQKLGRFTSADQLLEVQGIGPKTLEKMRPHIAL
jgi:comEA protein